MGISDIIHVNTPDAEDVYFRDDNVAFVADDVQEALEQVSDSVAVSASPGFTWGDSGVIPNGSYLLNDNIPSNLAGRTVPLYNAIISKVFVTMENTNTVSFDIQKRVGSVFTTLTTITVTALRKDSQNVSVPVDFQEEICVRVSPTSANKPKNPNIGIIIKGSLLL